MEAMDYWKLCDELTVVQAALLIVGVDPAGSQEYVLSSDAQTRPTGFDAAFAALKHAVLAARLQATIRRDAWVRGWNQDPSEGESIGNDHEGRQIIYNTHPDWTQTTVTVENLQAWLRKRGIRTGFFFPEAPEAADYINPRNEHYSPKLAAAISAWEAVSRDPSTIRGRSVKQAILIWLRRNSDRYGLSKEDGSPNEQGIEEIAKIANWDTKGGAPKTPGE